MNYLSLDVGTTCCKCQLFSEEGDILLYRSEEYPLAERDGEKYVDIESIWSIVQSLMLSAARAGGYASVCISTVSYTHLDVYKRQVRRRCTTCARALRRARAKTGR